MANTFLDTLPLDLLRQIIPLCGNPLQIELLAGFNRESHVYFVFAGKAFRVLVTSKGVVGYFQEFFSGEHRGIRLNKYGLDIWQVGITIFNDGNTSTGVFIPETTRGYQQLVAALLYQSLVKNSYEQAVGEKLKQAAQADNFNVADFFINYKKCESCPDDAS